MANKDISWIKTILKEIKEQVLKTNGIVSNHNSRLRTIEQKVKDHFFFHRTLKDLSRSQVTWLLAIFNAVCIIIAALLSGYIIVRFRG